jgi:hypothetical protein
MIDTVAILISHGLILYTIYRAAKLDKTLPWFGSENTDEDTKTSSDNSRNRLSK